MSMSDASEMAPTNRNARRPELVKLYRPHKVNGININAAKSASA